MLPWTFDALRRVEAPSIVLVVSPWVALIKDQVDSFTKKGVKAVHVLKEKTMSDDVLEKLHEGKYQLLFFILENLLTEEGWRNMFQSPVYAQNVVGFVVDEAHCVKKW